MSNLNNKISSENKLKVIHAQVMLVLLAIFNIISIVYLTTQIFDTLIPAKYFIWPIIANLLFIIPSLFCFKYPKTVFVVIGIFSSMILFRSLMFFNLISLIIFTYILIAMIVGYRALIERENMDVFSDQRDDILDSDLF